MTTYSKLIALFLLVTIIAGCNASADPGLANQFNNSVWVTGKEERDRIGTLDPHNGTIRWIEIPKQSGEIYSLSLSHNQQYVAVLSGSVTQTVSIYTVTNRSSLGWNLQPYTTLEGYAEAQWSPDSNELLLQRPYWSRPEIWKVDQQKTETPVDISHICSSAWGRDSHQVIMSVCLGDRQILAWSRSQKVQTPLLKFSLHAGNQYAIYALIGGWSPTRRSLLLDMKISDQDMSGRETEAPMALEHQYALLDVDKRTYKFASSRFYGYPTWSLWVGLQQFVSVAPESPLDPFSDTYSIFNMQTNQLHTIPAENHSCLLSIARLPNDENSALVKYRACGQDGHTGFYRLDLITGKHTRLDVQYKGELYFLTMK